MSDELFLSGKTYVSSKRAAETSGYAQDYIGQLCRGGLIDAQRVGGLWYVSMDSLNSYEKNTEAVRAQPVASAVAPQDPEALVNFDGKDYISASRASKLTGYNQDYIGQLARGNKILSRQIGNRWYVEREGLLKHKSEKDRLLAAVQSEAVGLKRGDAQQEAPFSTKFTYHNESRDLFPAISPKVVPQAQEEEKVETVVANSIPIRVLQNTRVTRETVPVRTLPKIGKRPNKIASAAVGAVAALTIILMLSYGIGSFKEGSSYAFFNTNDATVTSTGYTAGAASVIDAIGDKLEGWLTEELVYERR
jgi:hypothetical protein